MWAFNYPSAESLEPLYRESYRNSSFRWSIHAESLLSVTVETESSASISLATSRGGQLRIFEMLYPGPGRAITIILTGSTWSFSWGLFDESGWVVTATGVSEQALFWLSSFMVLAQTSRSGELTDPTGTRWVVDGLKFLLGTESLISCLFRDLKAFRKKRKHACIVEMEMRLSSTLSHSCFESEYVCAGQTTNEKSGCLRNHPLNSSLVIFGEILVSNWKFHRLLSRSVVSPSQPYRDL